VLICGIDPGLNRTGYGIIEACDGPLRAVDAGLIRTNGSEKLAKRIADVYEGVVNLLREYPVEIVAVEQLYSHYRHPRTAILMGHARGVVLLAALQCSVQVRDFNATQIKKALTGSGRAGKLQIQRSVASRLHLASIEAPHDVSDALAVAICCWEHHCSVDLAGKTK